MPRTGIASSAVVALVVALLVVGVAAGYETALPQHAVSTVTVTVSPTLPPTSATLAATSIMTSTVFATSTTTTAMTTSTTTVVTSTTTTTKTQLLTTFASGETMVVVAGTALGAADFSLGKAGTVTCVTSQPVSPYLTLTNEGAAGVAVTSITITWAGADNAFSLTSGTACPVEPGAPESSSVFAQFVASPKLSTIPAAGQAYTGFVTLSDGTQVMFDGYWK